MIGTRPRFARLFVAALLVVPAIVTSFSAPSLAAPTAQDVANAKEQVAQIQSDLASLNEQYNEALYQLQVAQQHLDQARAMKLAAEKQSAEARARLSRRAVDAYTGMGSQYDALLSSNSMTEFSDRLEFLGAMSQTDADLASQADSAAQQAQWASQEYDRALADRQAKADALDADRQAAAQKLDQAQQYYSDTQAAHDEWVHQQQLALQQAQADAAAAAAAAAAAQQTTSTPSPPPPDNPNPPAATGAGGIAANAALSKVGAPYVFGAAGPDAFDCSGLTMWAWGQAGVSIPHSATAQYSSLPRVDLHSVVPGDIIYYGNVSPHVAIYIGGGQIVHARHPGPGGQVQTAGMWTYDRPWAAMRPG
jgi:cell wall-associated NlpC family hydrolase